MAERSFVYSNKTADAVISKNKSAILHGVLLNSVAATATIQLFDDTTTTNPSNPIGGPWTPGAIVVPTFVGPLDIEVNNGIVLKIGVAAANVTVISD